MIPVHLATRLPTTAAVLVFSTLSRPAAAGHVPPQETRTASSRWLNVAERSATAAPAPVSPDEIQRRQFNTICGYIGGDPAFPATCLAGSHCVVDVDHGAVGCCPDGGACNGGVFTGCVDVNSPPQTELDPYVFTCSGSDVCYRNHFDGGYFQYGCGSASQLATTVATTVASRPALDLSRVSVVLTATPTALSEPTTIGSRISTPFGSAAAASSGSKATGGSDSSGADTSSPEDAASTADPSAPSSSSGSKATGPIVGGVIGGLVAVVALGMLTFWILRRRRQTLPKQYISPPVEKNDETEAHPYTPSTPRVERNVANANGEAGFRQPDNPEASLQDARPTGLAVPLDNNRNRFSDEIPLARDIRPRVSKSPTSEIEVEPYPPRRRAAGSGYLWSQNRSEPRSRDRSWAA